MAQNGAYSQKTLLSGFQTNTARIITEAIILFGTGMLAVFLHKALRIPMHLPGKQGFIWIALLVAGRCSSKLGIAGSLTGAGAAVASIGFIGYDPFSWAIYLTAGIAADFIFTGIPQTKWGVALLAVAFGAIHVLKPVIRSLIDIFAGIPHSSLLGGLMYPAFTHFVFGLVGAVLGIAIAKGIAQAREEKKV